MKRERVEYRNRDQEREQYNSERSKWRLDKNLEIDETKRCGSGDDQQNDEYLFNQIVMPDYVSQRETWFHNVKYEKFSVASSRFSFWRFFLLLSQRVLQV